MSGIGEVDIETTGEVTVFRLWNFDSDSDALKEVKHGQILRGPVLQLLRRQVPSGSQPPFAHLTGMASRRGNPGHNLDLSRRRVAKVEQLLRDSGVEAGRITRVDGVGEERSFSAAEDAAFDRAVIVEVSQSPVPVTRIGTLPRGGQTVQPPSPEHHILLFFGGACDDVRPRTHAMAPRFRPISCLPGQPMRTHDDQGKRTSQRAYEHFTPRGRFAEAPKWNPAISKDPSNAAVDAGLSFLQRPRPQGKLVIYGFSAGGFNAVQLCERIAGRRQVDLLITVDPCIQNIDPNGEFPIHKPPVVEHFNWYQKRGDTKGRSIGTADVDESRDPPPGPRSAHDQMPVYTQDLVEAEIARVLRSPARALHVPP